MTILWTVDFRMKREKRVCVSEFEYVHFLPDGTLFERLFEILSVLFENTGKSTLTVLVTMKSLIFRYFYFNFQAWNLLPKH